MATLAELNQQISDIEQALAATREQIAWRLRSLANTSDQYQANAAYRARLQAEIERLTATAAVQQQALNNAVAQRNQLAQTNQTTVNPATDPGVDEAAAAAAARFDGAPTESAVPVGDDDPEAANLLEQAQEINRAELAQKVSGAENVEPGWASGYYNQPEPLNAAQAAGNVEDDGTTVGIQQQINILNAQKSQTLKDRENQLSAADWRVKLQLAKSADYLYKATPPGPLLKPLADTDGVIFPYTPVIETAYKAKYSYSDLTHSNYKGYFYQSSNVEEITVRGTFTAQDTAEAQYLLAVIHFFRSVTKMFYGKDAQAGTPPPLVYLSAYGKWQFNRHPCVVTTFGYTLPQDVDYIRADGFNNYGLNLENRQVRSSGPPPSGILDFVKTKLKLNGNLTPGALMEDQTQSSVTNTVTHATAQNSTYVPTKMEISISLLPIQTRSQMSKEFSLKGFSNGDLLTRGFW